MSLIGLLGASFLCLAAPAAVLADGILPTHLFGGAQHQHDMIGWKGETYHVHSYNQEVTAWVEQLSFEPRMQMFHGALSDAALAHIANTTLRSFRRVGPEPPYAPAAVVLTDDTDDEVAQIRRRLSEWVMLPVTHQTALTVHRVEPGSAPLLLTMLPSQFARVFLFLTDVTTDGGGIALPQATRDTVESGSYVTEPGSACAQMDVVLGGRAGDALLVVGSDLTGAELPAAEQEHCAVLSAVQYLGVVDVYGSSVAVPDTPDQVGDLGLCLEPQDCCDGCEPCETTSDECYSRNRAAAGYLELESWYPGAEG